MKEAFLRRRNLICGLLSEVRGLKVRIPQGAFYVMPDITYYHGKSDGSVTIKDSDELALYLLDKAQVAVVSGIPFGAPECIRISYAASDENIKEAVKRIKSALEKLS
jgi:aspartate aminotransferase